MPINIFSTHPAEAVTSEGYRLYLIHNGTVDKDRILEDLGIDKRGIYASLYNDTYFLTQMIAARINSHIDEGTLGEIIGYTVSALNIGVILVRDRDVEVAIGSFYRVYDKAVERRNYYKIYRAVSRDPIYIYSSSTTIDIYRPDLDLKWVEIPNGLFEVYRIWYDGLSRVEKRFETIYSG
jgi:glutamine amidotransferase